MAEGKQVDGGRQGPAEEFGEWGLGFKNGGLTGESGTPQSSQGTATPGEERP